jgi:FkbM family methyltransferase
MSDQGELDELLNTDIRQVLDFERHGFDRVAEPFQNSLVLFGAGNLGRLTLTKLSALGIKPLAFADNSQRIQGTEINGVHVLSVEDAIARYNDRATFVVTIWGGTHNHRQKDSRTQLQELGCKRYALAASLFCKYPETLLPYYCLDLPSKVLPHADAIRKAFSLMADDESRREFVAEIRWRLTLDYDCLPLPVKEEMYFCDSIFRSAEVEDYVDCGAYDGDTLKSFLAHYSESFRHYLALEPDPINFAKMRDYVATLPPQVAARVTLKLLATGDRRTKLRFDATGLPSTTFGTQGAMEVDCMSLDELLEGSRPTTIKMDIEGAEYDTLKGARRLIETHAPLLEVCVYHTQDHVWSIPLLIHEMNPSYRLYLRPHKDEIWDLVCYAVPPERCAKADNTGGSDS